MFQDNTRRVYETTYNALPAKCLVMALRSFTFHEVDDIALAFSVEYMAWMGVITCINFNFFYGESYFRTKT